MAVCDLEMGVARDWRRRMRSLRAKSIARINKPGSSNSNFAINPSASNSGSSPVSNSVVEDHGAHIYMDQLKLYKAAKNDYVDEVLNFFYERDETLEELAPSFIYQTIGPFNNTLLHVAASYGSDETVQLIVDDLMICPLILTSKNSKGDTALHVAAKAGHLSTARILIRCDVEFSFSSDDEGDALREADYDRTSLLRLQNEEGNTALHEALINGHLEVARALIEADPEVSFHLNNERKSPLYMAAGAGSLSCVKHMLESTAQVNPEEKSPIHAAILNAAANTRTATEILECVLQMEPKFIDLRDEQGRTALHLAAYVGSLEIVRYLLGRCAFALVQKDDSGLFPIHIAAIKGHVAVIQELLAHCPDPVEMLGSNFQNLLHVAAKSGALNVVNYVLRTPELEMLINQKDKDGNTPLHLATMNWHPEIVRAMTWDKRVDLKFVNNQGLTALDAAEYHMEGVTPFRKRLTWAALKAAGAPRAPSPKTLNADSRSTHSGQSYGDYYKDRVNTLLLVSTLVVTVTFAAGFTMPGGNKDSEPDQGMATMLGHIAFRFFIFCDTIAMFSSITVAVTLIWAQLGDPCLVLMVLRLALPLLGIALIMMTLAFTAGIYLVVSKLSWLGIAVLVMGAVFVMVLSLLFFPLLIPSSSNNCILRRINYYLDQLLIVLTGSHTTVNWEK